MYIPFSEETHKEAGFYVYRYPDGVEISIYSQKPIHHHSNVYAMFTIRPNTKSLFNKKEEEE